MIILKLIFTIVYQNKFTYSQKYNSEYFKYIKSNLNQTCDVNSKKGIK